VRHQKLFRAALDELVVLGEPQRPSFRLQHRRYLVVEPPRTIRSAEW
jgi:hypothetical protein